jgi:cephalosporin-C deacetylase
MPCLDKPLEELRTYPGTGEKPAGFDEYWDRALRELEAVDPAPRLERTTSICPRNSEAFNLTFVGIGGARLHAKYVRPLSAAGRHPAVLEFHGYTGHSGDWVGRLAYAGEGISVAALDCRGQGGLSEDVGSFRGNTHCGHIVRGLDEGPDKLLYRSIFLDTVQLARVVSSFAETDPQRLAVRGASQGGALAVACAALHPQISRCVCVHPFLSDFQRVWEMDLLKDAYAELRTHLRQRDPLGRQRERIFRTLAHIDIRHLAPRVRAKVLMGITLQDSVCPPSTQFAVFNSLRTDKELLLYPEFGHEQLPELEDRAFEFLSFRDV